MKFSANNFFTIIKQVVVGTTSAQKGFWKTAEGVNLTGLRTFLSDNTGGAVNTTFAAGVGVTQIAFPVDDLSNATGAGFGATTAGDVVTDYVPGYRFKLLALDFITGLAGTGSSASAVCNLEIGSTNVTNGTCTVTLASTNTIGELTAGAAITGLQTGSATDAFSIEKATSTVFTAGAGTFIVTIQNLDTADAVASLVGLQVGTSDETKARVLKIQETVDTIGSTIWKVPRDYDEYAQEVTLRVLASQLTSSTDDDVELDLQVYHKTPGTALSADRNPTKPGTVLSTTEQWVEFDLSTIFASNNIARDDVITLTLITNGANDTSGEEILIHDMELVYRSCLVSWAKETTTRAFDLR